jgi:hypothetical protein
MPALAIRQDMTATELRRLGRVRQAGVNSAGN